MKQIKIKNGLPFYAAAAVWLLMGLAFNIYRPGVFIAALLISIAVFAAVEVWGPKETREVREKAASGDRDVDKQIEEGRDLLEKLLADAKATGDPGLLQEALRMENAGRAIFTALEKNAGQASEVRRFMNYYLPTSASLIEKYRTILATGVEGEHLTGARRSIANSFHMIGDAFEKQLDMLYKDEALDVETDIEVMQTILRGEGLIDDKTIRTAAPAGKAQTEQKNTSNTTDNMTIGGV